MNYNKNDKSEHREWQADDIYVQKTSNMACTSESQWGEVALNEQDFCMLDDEITPVKAFGDLACRVVQNENMNKEPSERSRDTHSQTKRRRTLYFGDQVVDSTLCNEEMSNVLLKSNERDEAFEEASQFGFSETASSWGFEGLDQASKDWLAECFNDTDMHLSSDDMDVFGTSNAQTDFPDAGYCNTPSRLQVKAVRESVTISPRNVVFKVKKSFIRTPTKIASSVAYPFAFVKPCEFQGDVTLKNINQQIHTPPLKSKKHEDPPVVYPTSAFSGKPVVGKTKIRTEGGKGSITIMRTKG